MLGFTLNTDEIKSDKDKDLYELLDFKCFSGYSSFSPNEYYPQDTSKIKLTQNSQGYVTLEQKHKIVWRVKNPDRFCYTDRSIIFYMGKAAIICSNYKEEILYLLSLLNSFVLNMVFELNLKSKNEKEYLIPIKGIKEYFRVPLISEKNQSLKDEVIKLTEEMLDLEDVQLQDIVDFSDITRQKFDHVEVRGNGLVLEKSGQEYIAPIKSKKDVVRAVIKEQYGDKELVPGEVVLSELKHLMAIDRELQGSLKDYIDDLVFALYFDVPIKKVGLKEAGQIKELCRKNEFYDYILSAL